MYVLETQEQVLRVLDEIDMAFEYEELESFPEVWETLEEVVAHYTSLFSQEKLKFHKQRLQARLNNV